MSIIPTEFLDLFNSKVSFAHLATINADGTPQVTPVWFDFDGTHILVNTAVGRTKDTNMRRDPRVTVEISDPEDPYRYVQVYGRVVDISTETGDAVIDKLAFKYIGKDKYPFKKPGEVRVTMKILPERVTRA
jgi:PPOX class probable F420-dependent enzyme